MTDISKKKTIILAITQDMKIYECFLDNLNFLNFETFFICDYKVIKYKSNYDRLKNMFHKIFFKNADFKKKLFKQYKLDLDLKVLNNIPNKADFSLTIRADLFDDVILNKIIQKSKKSYSYQWDGLSRFPKIYKLIQLFDKFYIFDKSDINYKHKVYPITNFYFDCYSDMIENKTPQYDAYYIGSLDSRIERLITICEFLRLKNLKLNIILSGRPVDWLKKYDYIKFINIPLSYLENLKMLANTKMIIDLHHIHLHTGLSFRSFEALGYSKKLITSNPDIKNYDFYNEKNIFILNSVNDQFDDFYNEPYHEINPEIKYKYSFSNWINSALEID